MNNQADEDLKLESYYAPGSTGTVGCVISKNGNVAAATSTGGLTNKICGRIGDTPIIGAGNYADNKTCAVSGTGKGEDFMRYVAAYDVAMRIDIGKRDLGTAVKETVFERLPLGTGGIIAVNEAGEWAMEFSSLGMFRGMCNVHKHTYQVGIWEDTITGVIEHE